MTDIGEVNRDSWELALISIVKKGKNFEPFSTSQIRKIVNASLSPGRITQISKIIQDYKPAPPQGEKEDKAQQEIKQKLEKNQQFGKRLQKLSQGHDAYYIQKLLQYTLWNMKIIEKSLGHRPDRLTSLLKCEGVENKEYILNGLDCLVK